jgi:hypothetical protein
MIADNPHLAFGLALFVGALVGMIGGLFFGASRRDGPAVYDAPNVYHEPMPWRSESYGGEK